MLPLTPREEQVAALVVLGFDTDQIAAELDISWYTARKHVRVIRAKCGAERMRDIPEALARYAPEE